MRVGHINLAASFAAAGEHFVTLIEALQWHGIQQHMLVRDSSLAKRLGLIDNVSVGATVRSSFIAYCMMPDVDVVHIHDPASANAGLLLALTRSVPFVLTHRETGSPAQRALFQASVRRASGVTDGRNYDAAEHMQLYRRAADTLRIPTLLL